MLAKIEPNLPKIKTEIYTQIETKTEIYPQKETKTDKKKVHGLN